MAKTAGFYSISSFPLAGKIYPGRGEGKRIICKPEVALFKPTLKSIRENDRVRAPSCPLIVCHWVYLCVDISFFFPLFSITIIQLIVFKVLVCILQMLSNLKKFISGHFRFIICTYHGSFDLVSAGKSLNRIKTILVSNLVR